MTAPERHCAVCKAELSFLVYSSEEGKSLTSLCRLNAGLTRVFACRECGHLQTDPLDDVAEFYDLHYDILVDSEDEDQIYEIRDGRALFRTMHQVQTLAAKLDLDRTLDVLDYGCAKSSTIRQLSAHYPGLRPHLFDVSERYLPFWEKFAEPGDWAVNSIPSHWAGRFDLVTSFFSLEHIPAVVDSMRAVASVLKPGGTFYFVVPNVMSNVADLIVVDHCNHFTRTSLRHLLRTAGLSVIEIDDCSHRGAYVVVASKDPSGVAPDEPSRPEVAATCDRLAEIGRYWSDAAASVSRFESSLPSERRVAVYGAGFYGTFITSCLDRPGRVACYLDQNPFLAGRELHGRPVLPPGQLAADVRTVLVGLNPASARTLISQIPSLQGRDLQFFYL